MTKSEMSQWAAAENRIQRLITELDDADYAEDDAAAERAASKLRDMGCCCEMTAAGWMITR